MAAFETVVQSAIYSKLDTDLTYDIYDEVPQETSTFPYITVGEDVHTTIDTDTELMNQVSIVIHTWSRYAGRAQTKQIQSDIYNSLHRANLSFSGYNFINIAQVSSESFMDSDGQTRHGTQTFNLLIEEL